MTGARTESKAITLFGNSISDNQLAASHQQPLTTIFRFVIIKSAMQSLTQEGPRSAIRDSGQELTALVAGCGIYRRQLGLLVLTGRDRVRWLNGMVSNNVRDLAVGRGVYAFVLTPQGHIQADLYAFNRGESLTVEIDRAQLGTVLPIFRKYIIMDKVEIEDLSEKMVVLGATGPRSPQVLALLGVRDNLEPLEIFDTLWNGVTLTVVRGDNAWCPSFDLWVPREKAIGILELLRQAGAIEVEDETVETFRILCGIPKLGQDIRERVLPQETGQERALNFTKGCYIGQEIVERIRSRGAVHRTLTGFEVEGPAPAPGTKIQNEGKEVGEVTSVTPPLDGRRLALGFLRKEFTSGDRELRAGEAQLKPAPLPFRNILA
jgi:folate-binding protein YgfZ